MGQRVMMIFWMRSMVQERVRDIVSIVVSWMASTMTYICPVALFDVADMDLNILWNVKSSRPMK